MATPVPRFHTGDLVKTSLEMQNIRFHASTSEITISPSSLVDCMMGFLKGGKVSSFDNPTLTVSLFTVAITVNQNQTKG
ncbi:hypothetical protein T4E_7831 [Trichinella pseudospiralis]|uniref:Uncharacterized protein n=1 Tax=Trichinella pseudospiralis TaxID=6337 RepID=A0A0V0XFG8_TRIPS|nr:hypothetical protein T4E_7831 [Trichinella pseudospiralis]